MDTLDAGGGISSVGDVNTFQSVGEISGESSGGTVQIFHGLIGQLEGIFLDVPIILLQPISLTVHQGTNATFSVAAIGPELSYQWFFNSSAVSGATASSLLQTNVQSGHVGTYSVLVYNSAGEIVSSNASLSIIPDNSAPILMVIAPKMKAAYASNAPPLFINGTVKDDKTVSVVEYNLNDQDYLPASITPLAKLTNWNAMVQMKPGTNTILIRARDMAGNYSVTTNIVFFWHLTNLFTLAIDGSGDVVAMASALGKPTNNAPLYLGRSYTVTAKATNAPAWIFTNWSRSVNGGPTNTLPGHNPVLSFTMETNLVIIANFITNPLVRLAGTYNGLFYQADQVRHHSAGYVTMKVSPGFTCTGKLLLDGNTVPFTAKLRIDGTATTNVTRVKVGKGDLQLDLAMDFLGGSQTLTGTVAGVNLQSEAFVSALRADRQVWRTNIGEQALDFTNRYTMIVTGFTDNAEGPYGYGYAAIDLTSVQGVVKLSGEMSDSFKKNVKLTQTTTVSKDGKWPLFAPLYNTAKTNGIVPVKETLGELIGWLSFVENTNAGTTNLAPLGQLDWLKTGWTNAGWQSGFTNQVQANSSRHLPPPAGATNRIYNFTNALVVLDGGSLADAVTNLVHLKTNNVFLVDKKNTNWPVTKKFAASLTAKTGLISGTFTNTPSGVTNIAWAGVILQDNNYGLGFFNDIPPTTNSSGRVSLTPID